MHNRSVSCLKPKPICRRSSSGGSLIDLLTSPQKQKALFLTVLFVCGLLGLAVIKGKRFESNKAKL